MTLRDLGRPADARPLAQRAVAIAEAAYGPDHPEVGIHLSRLAQILSHLGQPEQARPPAERAVAITETALGADHPRSTEYRDILARIAGDPGA